jgi:hypothetical protein
MDGEVSPADGPPLDETGTTPAKWSSLRWQSYAPGAGGAVVVVAVGVLVIAGLVVMAVVVGGTVLLVAAGVIGVEPVFGNGSIVDIEVAVDVELAINGAEGPGGLGAEVTGAEVTGAEVTGAEVVPTALVLVIGPGLAAGGLLALAVVGAVSVAWGCVVSGDELIGAGDGSVPAADRPAVVVTNCCAPAGNDDA